MDKACLGTNKNLEKLLEFWKKKDFTSAEARVCALDAYNSQIGDGHCVYWNDRFYISVMWGLDEKSKRESALQAIVGNGWKGYFTAKTPAGFDIRDALQKIESEITLDFSIIERIAEKFGLRESEEYGFARREYERMVAFQKLCKDAEKRMNEKKTDYKK